jgi:hypothetical protein
MFRSIALLSKGIALGLGCAALLEGLRSVVGVAWLAGVLPEGVAIAVYAAVALTVGLLWLGLLFGLATFSGIAAANVRSFEPDFHESPIGSVVGWLVPAWNLYKPYDSLSQIWSGTANHPVFEDPAGPGRLLDLFWVTWVLAIVVGRVFGGGGEEAWLGIADVVAAGLSMVCGLAGAAVVLRLGALQEQARAASAPNGSALAAAS